MYTNYHDKYDINNHDIKDMMVVKATDRNSLYSYSNIFNLSTFFPTLHVLLDRYIVGKLFRLMRIYNVDGLVELDAYAYDELTHPWIDIPVDCLNLEIGLHSYTIEFVNTVTGDTFYQYFNYTIQDDNPSKPYIYMKR